MKIQTEITPYGPTRVLHHAASQQLALRLSGDAAPTFTTSSALFYLLEEQAVLAKLMKPKSFPKDHVRRFFMRAEAYRVFWSARRLRIIGVDTPEPLGFSIILNPFTGYESIYYAEYKKSYTNVSQYIQNLSDIERLVVFKNIAIDYAKMINGKIHFKDLHFKNVMIKKDSALCWVDTDIRYIKSPQGLLQKIHREIAKLKHRSANILTAQEWDFLNNAVAQRTTAIQVPRI